MSGRPDIDWSVGSTEETFGVQVWINRIEGLKSHFRIMKDGLPDDAWLRRQAEAGIAEADRYIASAIPADDLQEHPAATPTPDMEKSK